MNAFEMIVQYPFVRYALICAVLISLSSSLLGVTLVLKRFSFIGDGLSHVAFGAMSIAAVMHLSNAATFTLPVTILAAVLLLLGAEKAGVKGDAALAMISVASLALGYLAMNVFAVTSNVSGDVCSALFGSTSLLTLSKSDVILTAILSAVVIGLFFLLYNRIFLVTFDDKFAKATGTNTDAYNAMIAAVIAVVIVLAMDLVGSLLVSALIIFPAMTAMRLYGSFRSVTICSAVTAVVTSLAGMLISISAATPAGATIVCVQMLCFALIALLKRAAVIK